MSETETAVTNTVTESTSEEAKTVVIEVSNPTESELVGISEHIEANFNFKVNVQATEFKFKKSVDKDTGVEMIRKPVVLAVPYPSVDGIVDILKTGGKGLELLLEAMQAVVNAQAREILYEDTKLTADSFPVDKLSWEYIANLPKAQRRGGGIPKETWADFATDYVEVMPAATGKTVEQCTTAAKLLVGKLTAVRTAEPVLNLLVEQLGIYAEASPNFAEYEECVTFLLNKAETYLNVSEEELLANL